jgi:spore coat polysaccharide biosynthesis predicted glycosyltransferase SpsG
MSKIKLGFYCNANNLEGLGHFYRSFRLSNSINIYKSYEIYFFGNFNDIVLKELNESNLQVFDIIDFNELKFKIEFIDYIFIDSYNKTQHEIDDICNVTKCIFIDDFNSQDYSRAYAIVNFTIDAIKLDYPKNIKKYIGTKFLPVKKEFLDIRKKNLKYKKIIKTNDNLTILFFFSGTNLELVNLKKIISIFDITFFNCKFIWLINKEITGLDLKNNTLSIIQIGHNIENLYLISDIVVSGGGLVKYECGYCGIQNFAISTNELQYKETLQFKEYYLTNELGMIDSMDNNLIETKLNNLISDLNLQYKFYENSNFYFSNQQDDLYHFFKKILI